MAERKQQGIEESIPVPLECLENKELGKTYLCGICKGLCRNPLELSCEIHFSEPNIEIPLYCERCLSKHLKKNGNKCPLTGHMGVESSPSPARVKRSIAHLIIFCPNGDLLSFFVLSLPSTLFVFCTKKVECFPLFFVAYASPLLFFIFFSHIYP